MKLKRLTIDNIASIEHAVIDFDAAPLRDEHLFLITGDTGSGKSTIIDCLCLALYGNTPRLKAAKKENYQANRQNGDEKDNLKTDDVKQLLRRGAVSADVELTFDDNNGIPYVATWHIQRARKKHEGRIMEPERTLRTDDGANSHVEIQGIKKIDDEIVKIVGLDMEQFFRTVVLAQGKFAEFLNSSADKKAELLQKMTGTDIYEQISIRIHKMTGEKDAARKILLGQMENITLLDDEQKAQISSDMVQLDNSQKAIDAQLKLAVAMAKWVEDKTNIDRDIALKSAELREKQAQTASPLHQTQAALLKDWDNTAEARQLLKEHLKAASRIQELEGQKAGLQEEFDRLCAALRAAIADIDVKQTEVDEMDKAIAQQEPNREMYAAIKQIVTLINQWREKNRQITVFTDDLARDEKQLPDAQKAFETAREKAQQEDQVLRELKQQYGSFEIADISGKMDVLNKTCRALETLKDKHDAVTNAEAVLNELNDKHADEKKLLDEIAATIDGKRVRREELQKTVERMTDWNQLLIHAQETLQEGQPCPICGNTISHVLAPKADSELKELRAQFNQAEEDLRQTQTQIQVTEKAIRDLEPRIVNATNDLKKRKAERETHWAGLQQQLANCGRSAAEMADKTMADALIVDLEKEMTELNSKLTEANLLSKRIQQAQQQLNATNQACHKAEMHFNTIKESIKHQKMVIESNKTEAAERAIELDKLLVMEDWQQRASDEFIRQLQTDAANYQSLVTRRQELMQFIEVRRTAIPAMTQAKESISGLKDNGLTTDQVPGDLENRWRNMDSKYLQWNTQLDNAKEAAHTAKAALDQYCDQHPNITMERLSELNSHRQEEIETIRVAHQALYKAIDNATGAIGELNKRQQELKNKKPDIGEENAERLEAMIAENEEKLNAAQSQYADLKAKLRADEENVRLKGQKKEALDKAEAEYLQWAELNRRLGSADGKTFRRIAQSYILGELLHIANGYLRQFNDRYTLEAQPDAVVILVRDQLQGDLTSVNTLSGGESFMVSLALALALSSTTGKMFSMDTLFIDEGFGSLSEDYLSKVMDTLNRLYDIGGRRVGIISHVESLKEHITTQIQVERDSNNNTVSRITVKA